MALQIVNQNELIKNFDGLREQNQEVLDIWNYGRKTTLRFLVEDLDIGIQSARNIICVTHPISE